MPGVANRRCRELSAALSDPTRILRGYRRGAGTGGRPSAPRPGELAMTPGSVPLHPGTIETLRVRPPEPSRRPKVSYRSRSSKIPALCKSLVSASAPFLRGVTDLEGDKSPVEDMICYRTWV